MSHTTSGLSQHQLLRHFLTCLFIISSDTFILGSISYNKLDTLLSRWLLCILISSAKATLRSDTRLPFNTHWISIQSRTRRKPNLVFRNLIFLQPYLLGDNPSSCLRRTFSFYIAFFFQNVQRPLNGTSRFRYFS